MNKVLKSGSVILATFLMISFAACNNNEKPTVSSTSSIPSASETERPTLKVLLMTGDDARKAINAGYLSADNFKTDLAEMDIEIEEVVGGDEYTNKLKAYNATGDLPDVFFSSGTLMLQPIINSAMAEDLLPFISKDGFAEKYTEKAAIAPNTDGKLYALQAGADMYSIPRIFYNKDVFTANGVTVPTTMDEFMAVCKTLKNNGIIPWATYGKDGWAVKNYLFQNLVMADDPQVIFDLIADKTDFSNPVCQKALTTIQTMVNEGVFQPGMLTMEYGAVKDLFTTKKAAMYSMMTWELSGLAADANVDFMYFPQVNKNIDMSKTLQYWGGPNSGYAVNAESAFLNAAVTVAEYCAMQEAKYFNKDQKAPTALDTGITIESASSLMEKNLKNFKDATLKVPTLSLHAFSSQFDPEFGLNAGKLLTGEYSAEAFAKALETLWVENFKK